ncbi:DUF930 domain-containing protein [Rhizobium sp. TRM95111]|uniref:DUF930 domain-containing protein n=1 Tax=Rhizobium alarense TaxID=2846851 RepID=UPI001F31FC92|nr:DUF930 domain-containing protein [Rhizobium alarense]MCF3638587.1 DUF930 domain-containing protein [Rhizobium alarense]
MKPLICCALALAFLLPVPAAAIDAGIREQLERLAPDEKLEQRCDIEAMNRISHDDGGFRPDKVIAYAFAEPKLSGTTLRTKGAVFRSDGEWYRLSYRCVAAKNRLDIQDFRFTIGNRVPRSQWDEHYLYD